MCETSHRCQSPRDPRAHKNHAYVRLSTVLANMMHVLTVVKGLNMREKPTKVVNMFNTCLSLSHVCVEKGAKRLILI